MTDVAGETPKASPTEGDNELHEPVGTELMEFAEIKKWNEAVIKDWNKSVEDNNS